MYRSNIQILSATPADAAGILAVRKQCWLLDYPNNLYGITAEDLAQKDYDSSPKVSDLSREIADNPNLNVMIAKAGERVVGCAFGRKSPEHNSGENYYVLPEYRGQGIGSAMITELTQWWDPAKEMVISVVAYNQKAINRYKQRGYELFCEILHDEALLPSGKVIPGVKMIRPAQKELNESQNSSAYA